MSKRTFKTVRPIDKDIINVNKPGVDASQVTTVIRTSTQAETMAGIRGNLSARKGGSATTSATLAIAIVKVPDGKNPSTLLLTDGVGMYNPEQDVLWHKHVVFVEAVDALQWYDWDVEVKTMRKMKTDDTIQVIMIASDTNTADVIGALSIFCKQ